MRMKGQTSNKTSQAPNKPMNGNFELQNAGPDLLPFITYMLIRKQSEYLFS